MTQNNPFSLLDMLLCMLNNRNIEAQRMVLRIKKSVQGFNKKSFFSNWIRIFFKVFFSKSLPTQLDEDKKYGIILKGNKNRL